MLRPKERERDFKELCKDILSVRGLLCCDGCVKISYDQAFPNKAFHPSSVLLTFCRLKRSLLGEKPIRRQLGYCNTKGGHNNVRFTHFLATNFK